MEHHQEPPTEIAVRQIQHADVRCELCAERHQAERCTSFPSIEERRQRAQYLWLCFTCLAKDHRTEDCSNIGIFSCALCDYDIHHHALCAAARSHATEAAEASSTPVVVPAEAHKRPLAPHRAEDLYQSTSAPVQRPTVRAAPAVTPEDLQQEPTMAEDRRAPKRQNRKPKK
ncbi:hypothetical protein AAVH_32480 [Aphelenchoides avenae]|nr:hypothetical protein AAVH_32480 [Aphelenchus avenae]